MNIYVTKSFTPALDEYMHYVKDIFASGILTNTGSCVKGLEEKLRSFLGVENIHYVTNGTIALQLALAALDITHGEIITTPFSYVATTSSILWEKCKPVFVDIEPDNFTIDASKIEAAITKDTKAIMAVHVFGYACDIDAINAIADKYNLKVIYDAAHTFGSVYKGRALSSYGDISTLSFHATKLFHTVEGGACIVKDKAVSDKLELQKRFGHNKDDHITLGINGKQSEFHAAMGLANFPYISKIIAGRKAISNIYDTILKEHIQRPKKQVDLQYNYAYYPVVFKSEKELLNVFSILNDNNIYPRRYFYPSLNNLPYIEKAASCPVSEDIALRIACLPLYPDLPHENVKQISELIVKGLLCP